MANEAQGFLAGLDAPTRRFGHAVRKQLDAIEALLAEVTAAGGGVDHGLLVGLGDDDHSLYALSDGSRGNFEVSGAVAAHEAAGDPHTQYETSAEAQAKVDAEAALRVAGDATVQGSVDTHIADAVDAHDASAISHVPSHSALIDVWLTGTDMQSVVGQLAAQLYSPSSEELDAMMLALNGLTPANPLSNSNLFASDLIVANHLAAGSVIAGKLDVGAVTTDTVAANAITTAKLATDAITSTNYVAPVPPSPFASAGSFFDLATGTFTSVGASITASGSEFKGVLQSDSVNVMEATYTDKKLELTDQSGYGRAIWYGPSEVVGGWIEATNPTGIQMYQSKEFSGTRYANGKFAIDAADGQTAYTNLWASTYDIGNGYRDTGISMVQPYNDNGTITMQAHGGIRSVGTGVDDQLRLSMDTSTGRPYISFYNQNNSGTLRRAGYVGYPTALSATPMFYVSSEAGGLTLTTASGSNMYLSPGGAGVIKSSNAHHFVTATYGTAVMEQWPAQADYPSLRVNGMSNILDYALLLSTTNTYLGSGTGGSTYVRGPQNSSTAQIQVSSASVTLTGPVYVADWYRSTTSGQGWYHQTHGVGIQAQDSSYVRIYGSGVGFYATGTGCFSKDNQSRPSSNTAGFFQNNVGTPWSSIQIVARNVNNGSAGIAFHAAGVAPILKCWYASETVEVRNNPDTGYVAIKASAFTVSSTLREKVDVSAEADDVVLSRAKRSKPIRFTRKVRPQTLRKTERFKELDAAWQAKGRAPLQPAADGRDIESKDHDCALDECNGTPGKPCPQASNDHPIVGLAAEEVYEYFPEAVELDEDGLPSGVDVAQVAAAAFAAVGALTRKLEAAGIV